MKTINYKGQEYKCEVTIVTANAVRIRVYDQNNVGNLYIWTRGYDMPKPYKFNTSKLICKNVVLLAFKELMKKDEKPIPKVRRESPATVVEDTVTVNNTPVVNNITPTVEDTIPNRANRRRTTRRDRFEEA